jgi:recombination protein RecT
MTYQRPTKPQQQQPLNPVDNLVSMVTRYESEIEKALPRHLNATRMIRMIVSQVRKNPKLAECSLPSFFGAAITLAKLGLEPGDELGNVYLIPRRKKQGMEVQLIIGYQGMIDLIERDGNITLDAHTVYAQDQFKYQLGSDPKIVHSSDILLPDNNVVIASYAVAHYRDGRKKFRVCPKWEIERARQASDNPDGKYSPWTNQYSEMAMKTAVRRIFKLLPKNPENPNLLKVLALDNDEEMKVSQNLEKECPEELKKKLPIQANDDVIDVPKSESEKKADLKEEESSVFDEPA